MDNEVRVFLFYNGKGKPIFISKSVVPTFEAFKEIVFATFTISLQPNQIIKFEKDDNTFLKADNVDALFADDIMLTVHVDDASNEKKYDGGESVKIDEEQERRIMEEKRNAKRLEREQKANERKAKKDQEEAKKKDDLDSFNQKRVDDYNRIMVEQKLNQNQRRNYNRYINNNNAIVYKDGNNNGSVINVNSVSHGNSISNVVHNNIEIVDNQKNNNKYGAEKLKEFERQRKEVAKEKAANELERSVNSYGYDLDKIKKKVQLLEGFGDDDEQVQEPTEIRVFVKCLGFGGTKVTTATKFSDKFTIDDLCNQIKLAFMISPVKMQLYSTEKSTRIYEVNDLIEDDVVFVFLPETHSMDLLEAELNAISNIKRENDGSNANTNVKEDLIKIRLQKEKNEQEALERMTEDQRKNFLRLKQIENKRFDCSICLMDVPLRDIYITELCVHKFCKECLGDFVKVQINGGGVKELVFERYNQQYNETGIQCPFNGCDNALLYHEVKSLCTKEYFDRYDKILRDYSIEKARDLMWCPNNSCGNVMVKESTMLICYACNYVHCKNCDVKWHNDLNCEEFRKVAKEYGYSNNSAEMAAIYLNKKWLEDNTKKCVKCNNAVQKNGGCNHMTCRCGHEFCWLCGGDYDQGRHFRRTSCRQFT